MSNELQLEPTNVRARASRCATLAGELGSHGMPISGPVSGEASAAAAYTAHADAGKAQAALVARMRATATKINRFDTRIVDNEDASAAKLCVVGEQVV